MRSRAAALGAAGAVVVLAIALLLLLSGGDGTSKGTPPASAAARLVPADALVYVHLSTDGHRSETRAAAKLANAFPSWPKLRDAIVTRLQAPGCDLATKALKSADEAALAIFDTGGSARANSLVLVDTGKQHPGAKQRGCGSLSSSYVGTFLAIGQPESLALAAKLAKAGGRGSLAEAAGPRQMFAKLPADRVVDGWLSADGVRRLLAPQGGLLGVVGTLFDQATLKGAAFGLAAAGNRAKLTVASQLDPSLATGASKAGSGFKPFHPTLASAVPADAMAYLGVSNLAPALQRLLAAAGTSAGSFKPLVGSLDRPLHKIFPGEVAIILTAATPAPVLTLLGATKDEAGARQALTALPVAVRKTLSTAVWDGKVAVATNPKGIAAVKRDGKHLTDLANWQLSVGNHPDLRSSLLFLDFSRLLTLGEETGLSASSAYRSAKADLQKVRAIGASTSGTSSESTAEISLLITP
ncbi:hypothetical protein [Baekduia sp.]|jgi:hypothetical protein|uniref:hypothetical protein n=1 Tax=Baekduia sp. TaxID=2600305 RepID=UPI002E03F176|nr:hypothetical protein [Baekduia sp.]